MRVQVCVPVTRKVLETPITPTACTPRAMTCRATACGSLENERSPMTRLSGFESTSAWRPVEVEAHRPKLGSDGRRGRRAARVDVPGRAWEATVSHAHEHTTAS